MEILGRYFYPWCVFFAKQKKMISILSENMPALGSGK